jgi:hypothetical protein
MSALGHKRTLEPLYTMSALPPKADIVQHAVTMSVQERTSARFSAVETIPVTLPTDEWALLDRAIAQ